MSAKEILAKATRLAKTGDLKYTEEDLLRIREEGAIEAAQAFDTRRHEAAVNSIVGRSGILPIHQRCSLDNFIVNNKGQSEARNFAKYYIDYFDNNNGSCFIFSGNTGTGKNHLSAAICNSLMSIGKRCLIITISELMIKMRKCYGHEAEYSEDEFIKQLIKYDLLIIDEIGVNKGTDAEKMLLNQVVDQRTGNLKPVGILTNLDANELTKMLGPRIIDRLKANNGQWLFFNWGSYR